MCGKFGILSLNLRESGTCLRISDGFLGFGTALNFGNCTQDVYILVECVREVEETLVGIGNKKDLGQLKYSSSFPINKTNTTSHFLTHNCVSVIFTVCFGKLLRVRLEFFLSWHFWESGSCLRICDEI